MSQNPEDLHELKMSTPSQTGGHVLPGTLRPRKKLFATRSISLLCVSILAILLAGVTVFAAPGVNVATHSQDEIRAFVSGNAPSFNPSVYVEQPNASQTSWHMGDQGALSEESMLEGLKMLNNIRYVAGLSSNLTLDADLCKKAQAGAFLNEVMNLGASQLSLYHEPPKPEGMDQDLFDLGYSGTSTSNLAYDSSRPSLAVVSLGWMSDERGSNLESVGHRRWQINPKLQKVGYGQSGMFYAVTVFDTSGSGGETGVVWPAQNMPVDYFEDNIPWSYSLGTGIRSATVNLTLYCNNTSVKSWNFSSLSSSTNSSGYYFNINNRNFGQPGCIIFRPDQVSYHSGDVFEVSISGTTTSGSSFSADYTVEFFSLTPAQSLTIPEKLSLKESESKRITAIVTPENASETRPVYTSSDPSVVEVDDSGLLTARGTAGQTATITASLEGIVKTCKVTIGIDISGATAQFLDAIFTGTYNGSIRYGRYKYTGKEIKPQLRVTLDGKTLVQDKDYEIVYASNADPVNRSYNNVLQYFSVVGSGEYVGSISNMAIVIQPREINEHVITATIEKQVYTGREIMPSISLVYDKGGKNERELLAGRDYSVERLSNNKDAGEASVTVQGRGNYTGFRTISFTIDPKDIADAGCLGLVEKTYSGAEQTQENLVVVLAGFGDLNPETDYDVSYVNNINAANASAPEGTAPAVIVTGKKNFTGSVRRTFTINPKPIADSDVTLVPEGDASQAGAVTEYTYLYTGSPIEPGLVVKDGEKTLVKDDDYTAAYQDNVNVPSENSTQLATVTVEGQGNYTGTVTKTFRILPQQISQAQIAPFADPVYTGQAVEPVVTLTWNNMPLVKEQDYEISFANNIKAVQAADENAPAFTLTGKGNFAGKTTVPFSILPKDISGAELQGVIDKAFNGSEQTQDQVTVTLEGYGNLVEGLDYELQYSNNIHAAKADAGESAPMVKAVGTGNFTGSASAVFAIAPLTLLDENVVLSEEGQASPGAYVFTGSEITPTLTVTVNGTELNTETDYTVVYGGNLHAGADGAAVLTVNGTGDYDGSVSKTFTILQADLATAKLSQIPRQAFTGQPIEPALTVTFGEMILEKGTDYNVQFSDNTETGTAAVNLTGINDFTGSLTGSFTIAPKDLSGAVLTGLEDKTFNGSEQTQDQVTVTLEGYGNLVEGLDYELQYSNNIHAAKADAGESAPMVKAVGTGNFAGTASAAFTIAPLTISDVNVVLSEEGQTSPGAYVFTGSAIIPSVKVTVNGTELISGTDYTVTCEGNLHAGADGAAVLTVNGTGDYTGRIGRTFTILPADLATAVLGQIPEQTATGQPIEPALTVTYGNMTLKKGTDYNAVFSNNTAAGTAAVTLTGTGDFTGSLEGTFVIKEKQTDPTNPSDPTQQTDPTTPSDSSQQTNPANPSGTAQQDAGQGNTQDPANTNPGSTSTSEGTGQALMTAAAAESSILTVKGDKDVSFSTFGVLQAKQKKVTKNSIKITWKKVAGAKNYYVYGNKCGKTMQLLQVVQGNSYTKKKLTKGSFHKFVILAVDGQGRAVAASKMLHIVTKGGKYTNIKKLSVNKKKQTLKKGRKVTIKVTAYKESASGKLKNHRKISYESSNQQIATVNKNGKVKAVSPGSCVIYVYAQNGVFTTVKVKVK